MRVNLFGVGTKSESPAITAQERVNCFVETRKENDRTNFALVGTPGLTAFNTSSFGGNPSRGMWAVNTLATPLCFTVHSGTLYSLNNAGTAATIGTINTTSGDVSMTDDGTNLFLVDGTDGWYYNMVTPAGLIHITDGNFPSNPKTATWQDTYFITHSGASRQFDLSNNSAPQTWPAININFTGSGAGAIQAIIADHSILNIFGDVYTEFWQDTGAADFPYSQIPGAAQEFGLASPWSMCKYDNSVAGLFKNKMGGVNISRLSGFRLQKLSDHDIDEILGGYVTVSDAESFAYMLGGHPMYQISFPTAGSTFLYDEFSKIWSRLKATDGTRHWGQKFANFLNNLLVSDYRNGNIYTLDANAFTDNGSMIPMEVTSKHIWNDDKYIGIKWIQIDVQSGVGLATGQGSKPQMMLLVSKDGGNSFTEVSWSSMGEVGQYTQRVVWRDLGQARDWVLRLRITDPVKRVITGASAEIIGAVS